MLDANNARRRFFRLSAGTTSQRLCAGDSDTPQHILRHEKQDKFPKRIQVGANRVAKGTFAFLRIATAL
jgi:hypothetical protein